MMFGDDEFKEIDTENLGGDSVEEASVSETIDAVLMAKSAGMNTIISHRSGETEESFIAEFTN